MNTKVVLYDHATIDQFHWPETEDAKRVKNYLYQLIKEGPSPYILNVSTKIYLITYNDVFFPITVNEREYENSYIASNFYALKFYEETFSKKHPVFLRLQKPFLFLGKNCLKLLKINKTVLLNNWLMTNSLAPKISTQELGAILDFLKDKFPSHTLIFRHVDRVVKNELHDALRENHFHLFKTREIFFYNPQGTSSQSQPSRKKRKDLQILEKYHFTIVPSEKVEEKDYARMLALYEKVYIDKHTKYSPQYTQKFFQVTHQNKMIHYVLLKREGVIEGFFSYFIYNNAMINCLIGYDISLPHSQEIYQVLTRLIVDKAEELGLVINDGSGGDVAKTRRGMKSSAEYMGLYHAHLPFPRRLLWNGIAFFYKALSSSKSSEHIREGL